MMAMVFGTLMMNVHLLQAVYLELLMQQAVLLDLLFHGLRISKVEEIF
jgi:hypothetical protein